MASISPDWLEFVTRWFGDIHRGVTHSLYMWPLLALAWAAAARRFGGMPTASLQRLWVTFFVIIGSHLVLDVLMAYRIYPAWPFSDARWALDIMPLYDVYIFTGWLILAAVQRRRKMVSAKVATIGLAIFLTVFSARLTGKFRAHEMIGDMKAEAWRPVRTIPDYYQPWVWYVRLSDTTTHWTPINIINGEILRGDQTINPWFPPFPGREHVRRPRGMDG